MITKTFLLRGHQHFFSTIATKELGLEVLEKVKVAKVEENHIIVNYSDDGMCIFEVIEDTNSQRVVEFISTAS